MRVALIGAGRIGALHARPLSGTTRAIQLSTVDQGLRSSGRRPIELGTEEVP